MDKNLYHIIVPAYHEGQNIFEELQKLVDILKENSIEFNLIVVDDGSEDDTFEQIESFAKNRENVEGISYDENRGKGYALREGFAEIDSQPDYVIFFDADGDIKPESAIWLIESLSEEDILAASKWHESSIVNYPITRVILSKIFNLYTKLYLDLDIRDSQTGLKMFRFSILDNLISDSEIDGYAFDTELVYLAKNRSLNIKEVPVKLDFGHGSSLGISSMANIFFDVLKIGLRELSISRSKS